MKRRAQTNEHFNATREENGGTDSGDVLESLSITTVRPRTTAPGTWVCGKVAGHRYQALVFPAAALDRTWEVNGDSRISKLWLQRMDDCRTVYNWDRGTDVPPQTRLAGLIVEVLAEGLASLIYG